VAANEYHFTTHWTVRSTVREVKDILGDALDLVRWWPAVYLEAEQVSPGRPDGVGKLISLHTQGWLPYTLRWSFQVTEVRDDGFSLDAFGDFVGHGDWRFVQQGEDVEITYDWRIRADKLLLRLFSPVLKPLFEQNHLWAMAKGEESLTLELRRRHAEDDSRRAAIPPPPRPTPSSTLGWLWRYVTRRL
jgi:hypothetical protein